VYVALDVAGEIEDLVEEGDVAIVGRVVTLDFARQVVTFTFRLLAYVLFQHWLQLLL